MKFVTKILVALIIGFNLFFAQPTLADLPKFTENPDYIEVTKKIEALTSAPDSTSETAQQLADLQFIKYTLESGATGGQCTNNTGSIMAVYIHDPEEEAEDLSAYGSDLYFLADGQTTDSELDCDGFYIPNDIKIPTADASGQTQELSGPVAIKILDGTQLVVKTNPNTGNLEFDAPLSKVLQAGETTWFIPNVSQTVVATRVPNAPTNEES